MDVKFVSMVVVVPAMITFWGIFVISLELAQTSLF